MWGVYDYECGVCVEWDCVGGGVVGEGDGVVEEEVDCGYVDEWGV